LETQVLITTYAKSTQENTENPQKLRRYTITHGPTSKQQGH